MSSTKEVSVKKDGFLRRSRKAVAGFGVMVGAWIFTAPIAYADQDQPPAPPDPSGANKKGADAASSIVEFLQAFLGPILTIGIGIIAIKFLVQREMTKFFQFAGIAVLVGILFFTPNLIENIAKWISSIFEGIFPGSTGFIFFG